MKIFLFLIIGLLFIGLIKLLFVSKKKPVTIPEIEVFSKPQPLPISEKKNYYCVKGKRWRFKQGNFLGATINLSPESYGAALLKRSGYSHKRTNK